MIDVPVTVAKLKPEYWEKIKNGEKRFEVRDEYTEADFFVFTSPEAGELLGSAKIMSRFELRGERDIEAIAGLADVTPQEAKELFGAGSAPLYVYRVRPCADRLPVEIARLAKGWSEEAAK